MNSFGKLSGLGLEGIAILLACVLLQSVLMRIVNALPYTFRRPLRWLHVAANSIQALLTLRRAETQPARTDR